MNDKVYGHFVCSTVELKSCWTWSRLVILVGPFCTCYSPINAFSHRGVTYMRDPGLSSCQETICSTRSLFVYKVAVVFHTLSFQQTGFLEMLYQPLSGFLIVFFEYLICCLYVLFELNWIFLENGFISYKNDKKQFWKHFFGTLMSVN